MEKICNKITKGITILLLSTIIISCANKEDKIIKKVSSKLASDISYMKKEGLSYDPYISVTQLNSYKDMNSYVIKFCLLQKKEKPIEYTSYFKKDGVYVFIKKTNVIPKTITKDMYEELYNWFDGRISLETPIYVLLINPKNYKYIVLDDEIYYPIDTILKYNELLIDSIRIQK